MSSVNRPTSPHLSIYRPQISSVLSILHRITGIALYAGTGLLVYWLWTLAYLPEKHAQLLVCMRSTIGQLMLIGWTAAFYYHFSNGIRHLFWDMGKGYSLPVVNKSGWLVLVTTVLMTYFTWNCIYTNSGVSL